MTSFLLTAALCLYAWLLLWYAATGRMFGLVLVILTCFRIGYGLSGGQFTTACGT